MSDRSLDIVRRIFDAFRDGLPRGDFTAPWDEGYLDPDSEWFPDPPIPGPESYRGAKGFEAFMRTWTEDFDDWGISLQEIFDAGERGVVVIARQWASGKASGARVELTFAQIYEFEDDRVIRVRNYLDPKAALKAARLS